MIHSELLQFTTLYKLIKYDDTIHVVILDIEQFPNLCGIPIYTSWCQLNFHIYILSISKLWILVKSQSYDTLHVNISSISTT